MRGRPWLIYKLLVLGLALVGGILLASEAATTVEARPDMRSYWALHYWECAFDAVSAATGCGLSTYHWSRDLTTFGQTVVLVIGVLSAAGYLFVLMRALSHGTRNAAETRMSGRYSVIRYVAAAIVLLVVLSFLLKPSNAPLSSLISVDAPWTAALSLGTARIEATDPSTIPVTVFAALGGVACFLLLPFAAAFRRLGVTVASVFGTVLIYAAIVCCLALLVATLDGRRGSDIERAGGRGGPPPVEAPVEPGFASAVRAIIAAQCGGSTLQPPESSPHRDASRFVLGFGVLLGGLFGAPGAGVLAPASLALALWLSHRRAAAILCAKAAKQTLIFAVCATLIVTVGLLLIEQHTASAFSSVPSFADAWLDAASAIGGANLSSELTATVTDRGLSSGIRTPTDQYQYGMVWLMAAMLVGRIAPLWIICRCIPVLGSEPPLRDDADAAQHALPSNP